jgi:hypothetical protein
VTEIVKRSDTAKGFESCRGGGSSNEHFLGWVGVEDWPRIGSASTERPSLSCASPPSGSCLESYAIPHDVFGPTLSPLSRQFTVTLAVVIETAEPPTLH